MAGESPGLEPLFEDGDASLTPHPSMFVSGPVIGEDKGEGEDVGVSAFLCRIERVGRNYISYIIRGARLTITDAPARGTLRFETTIVMRGEVGGGASVSGLFFKSSDGVIRYDTRNARPKVEKLDSRTLKVTIEVDFSSNALTTNELIPEILVVVSGFTNEVEVQSIRTTLSVTFTQGNGEITEQPETVIKRGKSELGESGCKTEDVGEPRWDERLCKLLNRLGPFRRKSDADEAAKEGILNLLKTLPLSKGCDIKAKLWCLPREGGAWYDWYADIARCCGTEAIGDCNGKPRIPNDCFVVREVGPKTTPEEVLEEVNKIFKKTLKQQSGGGDSEQQGTSTSTEPPTWLSLMQELLREGGVGEEEQQSGFPPGFSEGQSEDKDIEPLEPLPSGCTYCFKQYCVFDEAEKQIKYYAVIYRCCLPEGSELCLQADDIEERYSGYYRSICQEKIKEIVADTREGAISLAEAYIAQLIQSTNDLSTYYSYPTPWCFIENNDDCSSSKKWKTFIWKCVYNCSCGLGFHITKDGIKNDIVRDSGRVFLRTMFRAFCLNPKTVCENYDFKISNINVSVNYDTSYVECKFISQTHSFSDFRDFPNYDNSNLAYDSTTIESSDVHSDISDAGAEISQRYLGRSHCAIEFHAMLDITEYYHHALRMSDGNMHSCLHVSYDITTDCGNLGASKVARIDYSRNFCNGVDGEKSCCGYDEGVPLEHYVNKETGLVGSDYLVETLGPLYEIASDDIVLSPGMVPGNRDEIYNRALRRVRELGVPQPGCTYSIHLRSYTIYRKQRLGGGKLIEWWADIVKTRTRKRPSICCSPEAPRDCQLRYTVHESIRDDGKLVGYRTRYDALRAAERKISEYLSQPFNHQSTFWRVQLWCNPKYDRGDCTHETEWFANIYMCDSLSTFIRYPVISGCKQFRFLYSYNTPQEAYDAAQAEIQRFLRSTRGLQIKRSIESTNNITIDDRTLVYGLEFDYDDGSGEAKRCIFGVDLVAIPSINRLGQVTPQSWGAIINLCCRQDMDTAEPCSCEPPKLWTLHPRGEKIPCTIQFDIGPYHDASIAEYMGQQFLIWIAGDNIFHNYRVWCDARIYQEDRTLTKWYATIYLCRPTETIAANDAIDVRGNVLVESLIPPVIWTPWSQPPDDVSLAVPPKPPDDCEPFLSFLVGVNGVEYAIVSYLLYTFYNIINPPDGMRWNHQIWYWLNDKRNKAYFYLTIYKCKKLACYDRGLSDEICSGRVAEQENCITQLVLGPYYDEIDLNDEIESQVEALSENDRADLQSNDSGEQPCRLVVERYCRFDSSGRKQLFAEIRKCCTVGEPTDVPIDSDGNRCRMLVADVGPFRDIREAIDYVSSWMAYIIEEFDIKADSVIVKYWSEIIDKKVFDWNAAIFFCGQAFQCCSFPLPLKPSVIVSDYNTRWQRILGDVQSAGINRIGGVDITQIYSGGGSPGSGDNDASDYVKELSDYAANGIGGFTVDGDYAMASMLAYQAALKIKRTIDRYYITKLSAGLGEILALVSKSKSGAVQQQGQRFLSQQQVSSGQQSGSGDEGGQGRGGDDAQKLLDAARIIADKYYANKRFIINHCFTDDDGYLNVRPILISGYDIESNCNPTNLVKEMLKAHLPTLCYKDATVVYVGPGTDSDGIIGPFPDISEARKWFDRRKSKIHTLMVKRYPFLVPERSKVIQVNACASLSGSKFYYSRIYVCNQKSCTQNLLAESTGGMRKICPDGAIEQFSILGPFPTKEHALNAFYEIISTRLNQHCYISSIAFLCNRFREAYRATRIDSELRDPNRNITYPFARILTKTESRSGSWYVRFSTCCYSIRFSDTGSGRIQEMLNNLVNRVLSGQPQGIESITPEPGGLQVTHPQPDAAPPPYAICPKGGRVYAILGFFENLADAATGAISYISENRKQILMDIRSNDYIDYHIAQLSEETLNTLPEQLRENLINLGYRFDAGGCLDIFGCSKRLYYVIIYVCSGVKHSLEFLESGAVRSESQAGEAPGSQNPPSDSGGSESPGSDGASSDDEEAELDEEFAKRIIAGLNERDDSRSYSTNSDVCLLQKMSHTKRAEYWLSNPQEPKYAVKYIGSIGPFKKDDVPRDEARFRRFLWEKIRDASLIVNKDALLRFAEGDANEIFNLFNEPVNIRAKRFPRKIIWDDIVWSSYAVGSSYDNAAYRVYGVKDLAQYANQGNNNQGSSADNSTKTYPTLIDNNNTGLYIPVVAGLRHPWLGTVRFYDTSIFDEFMMGVIGLDESVVTGIDNMILGHIMREYYDVYVHPKANTISLDVWATVVNDSNVIDDFFVLQIVYPSIFARPIKLHFEYVGEYEIHKKPSLFVWFVVVSCSLVCDIVYGYDDSITINLYILFESRLMLRQAYKDVSKTERIRARFYGNAALTRDHYYSTTTSTYYIGDFPIHNTGYTPSLPQGVIPEESMYVRVLLVMAKQDEDLARIVLRDKVINLIDKTISVPIKGLPESSPSLRLAEVGMQIRFYDYTSISYSEYPTYTKSIYEYILDLSKQSPYRTGNISLFYDLVYRSNMPQDDGSTITIPCSNDSYLRIPYLIESNNSNNN